jgi:hypothetical protein
MENPFPDHAIVLPFTSYPPQSILPNNFHPSPEERRRITDG